MIPLLTILERCLIQSPLPQAEFRTPRISWSKVLYGASPSLTSLLALSTYCFLSSSPTTVSMSSAITFLHSLWDLLGNKIAAEWYMQLPSPGTLSPNSSYLLSTVRMLRENNGKSLGMGSSNVLGSKGALSCFLLLPIQPEHIVDPHRQASRSSKSNAYSTVISSPATILLSVLIIT
eukprot:817528-Rhodomonas_salina.2